LIKPTKGILKLVNKKQLSYKTTGVTFEVIEPKEFLFEPGQFITLMIDGKTARAYSICSNVKDLPNLSLAIETAHDGIGSNHIKNINIGHELTFIGPSGRLLLPESLSEIPNNLYFFATGTGIAPFISLFYKLVDLKYQGQINLFFGVRKETDIIFKEELEQFKKDLPNFNYKIFFSKPEDKSNKAERITSILPQMTDKKALYYICGHPLMVDEVLKGLSNNGIEDKNIFKEEFIRPKQTGTV